jgi:hypothetical protein
MSLTGQNSDRRHEPRTTEVSNHRTELKFAGVPTYQFKMHDLSAKGAGFLVRTDSNFLNMIQVGRRLEVRLITFAQAKGPSGRYQSRIEHISEIKEGRFRGHMVVGLSLLDKTG